MANHDSTGLIIDNNVFLIFELVFSVFTFGILAIFGVISNVLNIAIFVELSPKDSMTVGLLALSLTDCIVSVIELAMSVTYLTNDLLPDIPVDLWAVAYFFFGWSLYAGYLISCWITAIVSIERCFCVVSPFKVKRIFTRKSCVIAIFCIYVVHICIIIPVFFVDSMQWQFVYTSNYNGANCTVSKKWMYTIFFSDFSDEVEAAVDITAGLFLFTASQLVLITCSVWMTYSLKASSVVRSKGKDVVTKKKSRLTVNEKKLVKMVLTLCIIQTCYNLPRLTITIFYNSYPDISAGDKNFSTMIWTISSIFNHISCTTNTSCYYYLNSSYRKIFKHKICLSS